jgi:hypothetical protein
MYYGLVRRALLCETFGEPGHRLVLLWLLIYHPLCLPSASGAATKMPQNGYRRPNGNDPLPTSGEGSARWHISFSSMM